MNTSSPYLKSLIISNCHSSQSGSVLNTLSGATHTRKLLSMPEPLPSTHTLLTRGTASGRSPRQSLLSQLLIHWIHSNVKRRTKQNKKRVSERERRKRKEKKKRKNENLIGQLIWNTLLTTLKTTGKIWGKCCGSFDRNGSSLILNIRISIQQSPSLRQSGETQSQFLSGILVLWLQNFFRDELQR